MIRAFCLTLCFVSGAVVTCNADTFTLTCGTTPSSFLPTFGTCLGPSGPQDLEGISTQVNGYSAINQQEWQGTATLDFTDGPSGVASGFFVPCLAGAGGYPYKGSYGEAQAVFDGVWISTYNSGSETCGTSNDFTSNHIIPFSFGTTQSYSLVLWVSVLASAAGAGEEAYASLNGFEVFDASGNLIPATLTVDLATPEPAPSLPIALGFIGCVFLTRRLSAHH